MTDPDNAMNYEENYHCLPDSELSKDRASRDSVHAAVGQHPWLSLRGQAGTQEYATNLADWMDGAFFPDKHIACVNENGWWYAEKIESPNAPHH